MTLLIISSDCVMRRVASGERKGIRWKMIEQLEVLDFADDYV